MVVIMFKNNDIILTTNNEKKKILLNNQQLINIKIYTINEFNRLFYFDYKQLVACNILATKEESLSTIIHSHILF